MMVPVNFWTLICLKQPELTNNRNSQIKTYDRIYSAFLLSEVTWYKSKPRFSFGHIVLIRFMNKVNGTGAKVLPVKETCEQNKIDQIQNIVVLRSK